MTAHAQITFLEAASEYIGSTVDDQLEAGARRLSGNFAKRVIDLIGAIVGLLLLSPILVVIAVAICLETRGWPIFTQERTGLRGQTFVIYKFRTMRVCDRRGDEVVQAQRDDVRVTFLGRLLRRTSIDELPQLLNVILGEMSLIGPRPHAVPHDIHYAALVPGYNARFLAKPGLTGLAQVSGFRGRTPQPGDMALRIEKDIEYIRRWSFWFDLEILFRTPLVLTFHPMAF
ncbi:MAG TPA: sugar transferase [Caulobacteraceae bacterium]|jgi:lipopolysaccharide/colanic/teichoic acid biosynthesis glycosyltransferase